MTDTSRFLVGSIAYFLLVVVPQLIYLKRRAQTETRLVLSIFALWALWYFPYAPIHEGSHYLGGILTGMHLKSHQFIPPFWRGDFVRGYLSWEDAYPWQTLISAQAPYSIDGLIIMLGFCLFRWRATFAPFFGALILTETFLRSLYDVAVNYFSDANLGGTGDFHFLLSGYPSGAVHAAAWVLMLLAAYCAAREIKKARPQTAKGQMQASVPRNQN